MIWEPDDSNKVQSFALTPVLVRPRDHSFFMVFSGKKKKKKNEKTIIIIKAENKPDFSINVACTILPQICTQFLAKLQVCSSHLDIILTLILLTFMDT